MILQAVTPKFVKIERAGDWNTLVTYIFRIDQISYVNVTQRVIYFLDNTSVAGVTNESLEALQEILLSSSDKETSVSLIQLS